MKSSEVHKYTTNESGKADYFFFPNPDKVVLDFNYSVFLSH